MVENVEELRSERAVSLSRDFQPLVTDKSKLPMPESRKLTMDVYERRKATPSGEQAVIRARSDRRDARQLLGFANNPRDFEGLERLVFTVFHQLQFPHNRKGDAL